MARSNDAFSHNVNNTRGLLHASIGDIDALLRQEPDPTAAPPATQTERDTHTANAADLEEALRNIERLEGSVRYYRDDNNNVRKAFDNLKKEYQDLRANGGSSGTGPGLGSKEADLKEELRVSRSSLANLQMKYTQLEKEHRNGNAHTTSQNNNSPPPDTNLQARLSELKKQYALLGTAHEKCAAAIEALQALFAALTIEHEKCGIQTGSEAGIQQLQTEKQSLVAENARLHGIILNSKQGPFGSQQPSDGDLRAAASKIRTDLQRIAYKLSESPARPIPSDFKEEEQFKRDFCNIR
jgi:chromosome segregation ATPase